MRDRLGADDGFTAVEVTVVLFLLSVISVIVFAGFTRPIEQTTSLSGEVGMQRVATAQINFARRWGTFTPSPSDLPDDPGISTTTTLSTAPDQVSIAVGTRGSLGLAVQTDDGCAVIRVTALDAGATGGVLSERTLQDGLACQGSSALPGDESAIPPQSVTS